MLRSPFGHATCRSDLRVQVSGPLLGNGSGGRCFWLVRETSMKEDCATGMSVPHGCNDGKDVVELFKEALEQRIGNDRFRMWFGHGVSFEISDKADAAQADTGSVATGQVVVRVRGQFALDRLRKNFLSELRGAAMVACGSTTNVAIELAAAPAAQTTLPIDGIAMVVTPTKPVRSTVARAATGSRGKMKSMSSLIADGAGSVRRSKPSPTAVAQPELPLGDAEPFTPATHSKANVPADAARTTMTVQTYVAGSCNQMAHTAMTMVSRQPGLASPLFICGPSGSGKTHLLSAIADQFRRRHRMRRVMHLSAEQFTNDFISSVGNTGITSFRRRYREVDALLIDDVQFLGAKKATLRELLYTVETLSAAGRPLVFSGLQAPTDIQGLSQELAGRMAAGLVCPVGPLDLTVREAILRRWIDASCNIQLDDDMIAQLTAMLAGDGRVISGVVNTINLLGRMYGRAPTMDEIRRHGGDLLRSAKPVASLSVIETAVCDAFGLPTDVLRSGAQTRAVSEPRMLAMYLSRQMTSAAYTEIARHFGGKSHSTAIAAEKNVKTWIEKGKSIGRGQVAMTAREAIERIENLLRA